MRNISFGLTQKQFLDGSKDVTRRLGWNFLVAGDRLCAVDRVMGFKPGQKPRVLGTVEVVSVRRERLSDITDEDVAREGFPELRREQFIAFFTQKMKCDPDIVITRIEFRRVV